VEKGRGGLPVLSSVRTILNVIEDPEKKKERGLRETGEASEGGRSSPDSRDSWGGRKNAFSGDLEEN